jgi:hypothetical protein
MLAHYLKWHMPHALAPMLFADDDPQAAEAGRPTPIHPRHPLPQALRKARRKHSDAGQPVHSFRSLLGHLATITVLTATSPAIEVITTPHPPLQQRAFQLLGVSPTRLRVVRTPKRPPGQTTPVPRGTSRQLVRGRIRSGRTTSGRQSASSQAGRRTHGQSGGVSRAAASLSERPSTYSPAREPATCNPRTIAYGMTGLSPCGPPLTVAHQLSRSRGLCKRSPTRWLSSQCSTAIANHGWNDTSRPSTLIRGSYCFGQSRCLIYAH